LIKWRSNGKGEKAIEEDDELVGKDGLFKFLGECV